MLNPLKLAFRFIMQMQAGKRARPYRGSIRKQTQGQLQPTPHPPIGRTNGSTLPTRPSPQRCEPPPQEGGTPLTHRVQVLSRARPTLIRFTLYASPTNYQRLIPSSSPSSPPLASLSFPTRQRGGFLRSNVLGHKHPRACPVGALHRHH